MGIGINDNQRTLNALNALRRNQAIVSRSFSRLSSGLRVQSAADDAAGLAIGSRLNSQLRGLNQAVRNASDGISLAQTEEGALAGTTDALQRIRELAVQAGNGALSAADRRAIQGEIDQLGAEIDRIGGTTTFNGQRLLDGTAGTRTFQVGAGSSETVSVGAFDARAGSLGRAAVATSGAIDASGLQPGELTINGVAIRATQIADDTRSTAQRTGSAIALAAAINASTDDTGVTATVNSTAVEGDAAGGGTLDAANRLEINGVTITGVNVAAGDAGDALRGAINAVSDETGVVATRNADGGLTLTAKDGRNIDVEATGTAGATTGLQTGTTTGTVTLTSDAQFTVAGADPADAGLGAGIVGVPPGSSVSTIDVRTPEGADRALEIADRALAQVTGRRARLGALQNRFQSAIDNLSGAAENVAAAQSRIVDTDFAQESANLLLGRLREQANVAVLAQANVSSQIALRLLGG